MDKATRDTYREAFTDTLESVDYLGQFFIINIFNGFPNNVNVYHDYYKRAVRYGQEIGLDTEYVRDCLIVCFTTGMRRAVEQIRKNTRCDAEFLDLLKEVIS